MTFNCGKIVFVVGLLLMGVIAEDSEISKAFLDYAVVPDVISTPPQSPLEVTYDNGLSVETGNELTPTQVKLQPEVQWDADDSAFYTLIMTDPDAPSRADPKFREFAHWLVANIPGSDIEQGDVLSAYVGSGPPKNTGLHRYVFLLYKQPGLLELDEKRVSNKSREGRPKFRASEFAKKYNLGDPIAGNFYQAQYDDYVPILHAQLSEN